MEDFKNLEHPVLCIVGPTASGKSELAQRAAVALGGEVVSADSMQIYEGMDIGTGKVLPQERRVPHFGLDIAAPGEAFSAQKFQDYARKCFVDISSRGDVPILCGGTGFYVKCAIDNYNLAAGEQVNNPSREKYNAMLESHGAQTVWCELNSLDPESAAMIHPNNSKRVIRALEMHEQGISYARQAEKLHEIPQIVPAVFVGLEVERSILYDRINARVDKMIESGLIDEVRTLVDSGFKEALTSKQAIGYKEIVSYLEGQCTLEEAVDKIKQQTRRYAKRQISWFKADSRIYWLRATELDFDALTKQTVKIYKRA